MQDGEMGFDDGSSQVKNIRDPGQPTAKEHQEHMTTHRPYRSWCKFCVMRRGVNAPHRRSDAQDHLEGVHHVSMDYGFLGERESVDRVPWIAKRAAKFIDQLVHNRVTHRCDNELTIEALAREIAQARQEGSQTMPETAPVGESQSNGITERAVELDSGQFRTLNAALEHRIGTRVPPDARILWWMVEFAAYLMNRCDIGSDERHRSKDYTGEGTTHRFWILEKGSWTCPPNQWKEEIGSRGSTQECLLACWTQRQRQWLSPSSDWRSRQGRRTSGEHRSRRDGTLAGTLAEYSRCEPLPGPQMARRSVGGKHGCEDLPTQERLRAVGSQRGLSRVPVSENWSGKTASSKRSMPEEDRRPVEGWLVVAADERTNRALADAVERDAAKDPGVRASQKKIALDTEQDWTPFPQSHAEDHRRQVCDPAPPQGLHRTPTRVKWGEGRDRNSHRVWSRPAAAMTLWWRSDGGRQWRCKKCKGVEPIRTRQQNEDRQRETTGGKGWAINRYWSARPEEDLSEDDSTGPCGSCHHARGTGRVPRETMRVANIENNSLNWVSISSAWHDELRLQWEAGTRQNETCRWEQWAGREHWVWQGPKQKMEEEKDKDHVECLCEAQVAQGRYFVHELTSEASSRMNCIVKIMAMPGTRAAAADLCMFGFVACANDNHAWVDAEDTIGRKEQTGTWVRQAARSMDDNWKKGQAGAADAGAEEESGRCKQDMQHHPWKWREERIESRGRRDVEIHGSRRAGAGQRMGRMALGRRQRRVAWPRAVSQVKAWRGWAHPSTQDVRESSQRGVLTRNWKDPHQDGVVVNRQPGKLDVRARSVAKEYKTHARQKLCASAPPLEALKSLLSSSLRDVSLLCRLCNCPHENSQINFTGEKKSLSKSFLILIIGSFSKETIEGWCRGHKKDGKTRVRPLGGRRPITCLHPIPDPDPQVPFDVNHESISREECVRMSRKRGGRDRHH